jgi:hypothetical protein
MKKKESKKEKSTLNDYHQKRNKVALKAVAQMLKQPKSSEEMRLQVQQSLNE